MSYKKPLSSRLVIGLLGSSLLLSNITIAVASHPPNKTKELSQKTDKAVHKLQEVEVNETALNSGLTVLDGEEISSLALGRKTIPDSLRLESFIQYAAKSRSGHRGGEITPAMISIRGSNPYDNAFSIDGLSSMNTLNPGEEDTGPNSVPAGGVQTLVLPLDLVNVVSVYSENVSAEYGDFTGGVVDATVRDAKNDRWHISVHGRRTSDKMTHQRYHPSKDPDNPSIRVTDKNDCEPDFSRYSAGFTVEGPIKNRLGVLVSYEKTHANVAKWVSNEIAKQRRVTTRDRDAFLIKLNTLNTQNFKASATLMHNPYLIHNYPPLSRDGEFKYKGGGTGLTLNLTHDLSFGQWRNDLGVLHSRLSRTCDSKYSYMSTMQGSETLPFSPGGWYGGFGSYWQSSNQYTWASKFDFKPVTTGPVRHEIKTGVEVKHMRATSETTGIEVFMVIKKGDYHGTFENGVIEGEMASTTKTHRPARTLDKNYTKLAAYIEDTMNIKRLTLRPGFRVSYDNVTGNVNTAPRLFADLSLTASDKYHLTGGWNRYYGDQIVGNYIALNTRNYRYTRKLNAATGEVGPWKLSGKYYDPVKRDYRQLQTPYSDEYALGFTAELPFGFFGKVTAVKRDYRKQIRTEAVKSAAYTHRVTNKGRNKYKGLTLSLDKSWDLGRFGRHKSRLGVTWSERSGNAITPLIDWREDFVDRDFVYLDDKKIAYSDLPAKNFNTPLVVTYSQTSHFWNDRLRLSGLFRFEKGTDRLLSIRGGKTVDGVTYKAYTRASSTPTGNLDLNAQWDILRHKDVTVTLDLDVLNVFDRENLVLTGTRTATYSNGRQFFIGLSAKY